MIVKPFRGLRPRPDLSAKIPSYPYDVVNREEAAGLAEGDPHSFLRVVRAEIELAPDVDPYDDRVYERARHNFLAMIERGWLVRDERPAPARTRGSRAARERPGRTRRPSPSRRSPGGGPAGSSWRR